MRPEAFVRPMETADLPAVSMLERQCAGGWNEEQLAGQLGNAAGFAFVICLGDEVVAYVCGAAVAGEAEIFRLAVRVDCRRHGYGRHLLGQTLLSLVSLGVAECWLEVRESNLAAMSLYSGCDFREEGRRRRYYSAPVEDAVLMKKNL